MILFSKKRFPEGSCSKVYTPNVKLWGRGGGVRLSARNLDVLMLSLYFPPRANLGAAAGVKYRSTVTDLIGWTEQVISDAPHRTLTILGLDLNDRLGRLRGQLMSSDALSTGCQSEDGFAGKLFRDMLERQHMYVATGPHFTYHEPKGNNTTIDYIVLPRSYADVIRQATVLEKSGRLLQHAKVRRPLDHDPVALRFEYSPDFFKPDQQKQAPLDIDLLILATMTGYRRQEFIEGIEHAAQAAKVHHPPHSTMADHKWMDIVEILRQAATELFAKGPHSEQMDDYKALLDQREAALRQRRRCRAKPVELGEQQEPSEEERQKAEQEQEVISWKLKELTRQAQGARRRWEKVKREVLEEQLVEAERLGRHATVYMISRLLSGKRGPKARNHRAVKRHQTSKQWEDELAAPGHMGGMGAVLCSFDEEWEKWTNTATFSEKEEPDANAYREAEDLIRTVSRRFTTCDKRRVAPPWSVPNEVWLLALWPNWRKRQDKAVGAVSHELAAPTFLELLTRKLAQTISTRQAPLIAHRSRGADIAKPNGKLRLLHILCPFWTQVYSAWFQQWGSRQEAVYWEHGFFRHKWREEALLVCEIAGDEARREGRCTLDTLHDATNAFASTLLPAYAQTINLHAAPTEHHFHDLFLQRQRDACVDVPAADGVLQVRTTM